MKERILERGVGRVLNLDETLPPSSHIRNYWTPLHTFSGKRLRNNKPQHVFSGTAEPRGVTERPGNEHEKMSINIDFVPPPPATNKSNISGGIEGGAPTNRLRDGAPQRKTPRKVAFDGQKRPEVSIGVQGCL